MTYVESEPWKDAAYWKLPENVRNAIDIAKVKSAHSEFWYKLENMNEKLMIFKHLFYGKMPHHQQVFYEKQQALLAQKMKNKKESYEKEMRKLQQQQKKKKNQDDFFANSG